jgi:hypothetical protein
LFATLFIGWVGAGAHGCSTYSDLEVDQHEDAKTPAGDTTTPVPDASSPDTGAPKPDGNTGADGVVADLAGSDITRDVVVETAPPADAPPRDVANDASLDAGSDVVMDAPAPGIDADSSVPPTNEAGLDVAAPDADGGPADADAAPTPDADAATSIDVDSGPTCWGTPSTHDEDSDGVVDECDNCPSLANANQADVGEINAGQTADGVGDACDPRPAAGGDGIFLFDGMNFTTLPPEWTNVGGGGWAANGTSLAPTGTSTGQELKRAFPSSLGNYLAETAFTFLALTSVGSASIPFRTDASRNGWGCGIGIGSAGGNIFLTQVTGGTGETTPTSVPIADPMVGNRYRVLAGGYNSNLYCMTTGARVDRTGTTTNGETGIRASGTRPTFEYLLVYRLGGIIPP